MVDAQELTNVDISRVSLVEAGANGRKFDIFKSANGKKKTPRESFKAKMESRKDFNAEYDRSLNGVWDLFWMMHDAVFNDAAEIEEETDVPVNDKELLAIIEKNYAQFKAKADEAIAAREAEEEKEKQKALLESSPRTIGEIVKETLKAVFGFEVGKRNEPDETSKEEGTMASEEATAIVEAIGEMGTKVTDALTALTETMNTRFDALESAVGGEDAEAENEPTGEEKSEGEGTPPPADSAPANDTGKSSELSEVLGAIKALNANVDEIAAKSSTLESRIDTVAKARGVSQGAVVEGQVTQEKRKSWGAMLLGVAK